MSLWSLRVQEVKVMGKEDCTTSIICHQCHLVLLNFNSYSNPWGSMVYHCDAYGTCLASEDGILGDQAGRMNFHHIPEDVCTGHLCPSMRPAFGVLPLGVNQGSLFISSFNNYSLLSSPEQEIRVENKGTKV